MHVRLSECDTQITIVELLSMHSQLILHPTIITLSPSNESSGVFRGGGQWAMALFGKKQFFTI